MLFDGDGELIGGSKNYFVCYQTFILQKFSNYADWNLTVSRSGDATYDMYVQDNTFCSFNIPAATGFFRLPKGGEINLLPSRFTGDTTGDLANNCAQAGKSWLDDLVVVAVKVNGRPHTTHCAALTYTISAELPRSRQGICAAWCGCGECGGGSPHPASSQPLPRRGQNA